MGLKAAFSTSDVIDNEMSGDLRAQYLRPEDIPEVFIRRKAGVNLVAQLVKALGEDLVFIAKGS